MKKFECPHCGYEWTMSYWKWIFTTPFHWFSPVDWRDFRLTKCPSCHKKGWLKCK